MDASKEVPRRVSHPQLKTIGIRVPEHRTLQQLLALHKGPLLATTLIPPGESDPLNDAHESRAQFEHHIEAVLDAGACPHEATTVVDLTGGEPVLLRQGRGDAAALGL
jgi:tRNA A37 threonylcarbamoyladenosine synthetase subunit TsaC/SUA5/YrdC